MKTKHKTSMMLSETARGLLRGLASDAGISQSAMIEILLREKWANVVLLPDKCGHATQRSLEERASS